MPRLPPIFDAQIHAGNLNDQDLRDLAFFGVEGVVAVAGDDAPQGSPADLQRYFETLVRDEPARLRKAGLAPFSALGVHPRRIPPRGFEEVLAGLPALFGAARVVAVGAIGLEQGGALEEQTFARQLEVAQTLRKPVIVHTPEREKPRMTRRALAILRESGLEPERVLIGQVDARTVRLARECGHLAGLMVHPARIPAEEAVRIVRQLGSADLVLASDMGAGPGDLLALPRTVYLMEQAGLSPEITRRVARDNALAFFGIDPAALG